LINLSENIVTEFASSSKFIVRYFLESKQGLSFARNRSVKELLITNSMYRDRTFGHFHSRNQLYYNEWNPNLYIDGSMIIIKRHIAIENQLSDYLHWGEKEDVDFSKRLYLNGYLHSFYEGCYVTTLTYMKIGQNNKSGLRARIYYFQSCLGWLRRNVKEYLKYKNYIK